MKVKGTIPKAEKLPVLLGFLTDACNKVERFTKTVVSPLKKYVKSNSESKDGRTLYDENPDIWTVFALFEQIENYLKQIVRELSDNCRSANADGPFTNWINTSPKIIQTQLKFVHFFYVLYQKFFSFRQERVALDAFLLRCEESNGMYISRFFFEFLKFLDAFHSHLQDFRHNLLASTNDLNQIAALNTTLEDAIQESNASINNDAPKKHGKYLFSPIVADHEFGTICEAFQQETRQRFKAHIISRTSSHSLEHQRQIQDMIDATIKCVHNNILALIDFFEDELFYFLIFPFTEGMELSAVLSRGGALPEEAARPIFRQMMCAIRHIHANGIVHGHITPGSVLFYGGRVRLFDFSYCHTFIQGQIDSSTPPPLRYASPDSLKNKVFDGVSADLWSAGVILYEMIAGKPLFSGTNKTLKQKVMRCAIVYPKSFSSLIVSLLKGILQPLSSDRMTVEQILSHPWMKKTLEVTVKNMLAITPPATPTISPFLTRQSSPRRS